MRKRKAQDNPTMEEEKKRPIDAHEMLEVFRGNMQRLTEIMIFKCQLCHSAANANEAVVYPSCGEKDAAYLNHAICLTCVKHQVNKTLVVPSITNADGVSRLSPEECKITHYQLINMDESHDPSQCSCIAPSCADQVVKFSALQLLDGIHTGSVSAHHVRNSLVASEASRILRLAEEKKFTSLDELVLDPDRIANNPSQCRDCHKLTRGPVDTYTHRMQLCPERNFPCPISPDICHGWALDARIQGLTRGDVAAAWVLHLRSACTAPVKCDQPNCVACPMHQIFDGTHAKNHSSGPAAVPVVVQECNNDDDDDEPTPSIAVAIMNHQRAIAELGRRDSRALGRVGLRGYLF